MNVCSDVTRHPIATPDHLELPTVLAWQEASRDQDFRITAITRAEMVYGVAILPVLEYYLTKS